MSQYGRHIEIRGTVQGVGFRPWVYQVARRFGIHGSVRNDSRGVVVDAYGSSDALNAFLVVLETDAPRAARVQTVEWTPIRYQPVTEFTIEESVESAERRVSVPADLATCDECLAEILDPSNRRYRYPFTNCTHCGPRYTIVKDAPYDRRKTSMSCFEMCADCRAEYENPLDRRFHAQPNACAKCGPQLVAVSTVGQEITTADPIRFAARAIRAGLIVAIKGVGGFHLACDAGSTTAVTRLRDRKGREAKPLAVMVRDVDQASAIAEITEAERALLTSVERPVVLAPMRETAAIAPEVTTHLPLIGLFLPYTPLHHLLMRELSGPIVLTSGNRSDEPMVLANRDARKRLEGIADVFLMHDRDILSRADDSVVRVIAGAPALIRRGRGYVPRAIETTRVFEEPILACGAQLKNTFCLAARSSAFPGPHIGDLDNAETFRDYEYAIEQMKQFVGVEPKVLAHDLHPGYLSTRYAEAQNGVTRIGVQHHHAHIVSVMAEYGLEGNVIGVAYDGTGYGTDGTAWGGEILLAGYDAFERIGTFRPVVLPGGDQAIRQPWRIALALLDDAFGGDFPRELLPVFAPISEGTVGTMRRAIASRLNAPLARGVGRYFDAFGSFILGMAEARYEGEIALRWNLVADPAEHLSYPFAIGDAGGVREIDLRATARQAVNDFLAGRDAATISARFHNTIARATTDVLTEGIAKYRDVPVVLTGGCFQNARLAESIFSAVQPHARVFMNRAVPAGDGGLSLGQAFIANARLISGKTDVAQEQLVCV